MLNTAVALVEYAQAAINLVTSDGTKLQVNALINAAGLRAVALAKRFQGLAPAVVPARGDAFYAEVRKYWPGLQMAHWHRAMPASAPKSTRRMKPPGIS